MRRIYFSKDPKSINVFARTPSSARLNGGNFNSLTTDASRSIVLMGISLWTLECFELIFGISIVSWYPPESCATHTDSTQKNLSVSEFNNSHVIFSYLLNH
mmetsp:Transcript_15732/g.33851  ORF Transcript_15732/g.33851 Transcript_15732/m.33851 type:complete len:101 (-) Transcript_15732:525-827(-)